MSRSSPKSPLRRAVREDTMLPEYDFSRAQRGVTAKRYAEGTNVVLLDADVAAAFPDAASVNEALRTLMRVAARQVRRSRSRA
ncbi:MAG: hypothetical protein ABR998_06805 [Gemmatimonadales bacterium]